MNDRECQRMYERDAFHAYHRACVEAIRHRRDHCASPTYFFLEDEEDWTPVPMDTEFWLMVAGGLSGLRRQLFSYGLLQDSM
jgi:hypothetical protein